MSAPALFQPVGACWVCGGRALRPVATALFEFALYREQDPALDGYTGASIPIVECTSCGFAQPSALPTLPDFFARMYDQRWSDEWVVLEFELGYKDRIFLDVLAGLARRTAGRVLLDVGAHVGRLIHLASSRGWQAEGVELNPKTAEFAAARTGLVVHREDAAVMAARGARYDAITLIDVLEHIPDPVPVLRALRALLAPGGCLAVKVPNGKRQREKESLRATLRPGYRATIADNLVHVNHFSPSSLALALREAGYRDVEVGVAAPEIIPGSGARSLLDRIARLAVWRAASLLPGGVHTPLALHLQAYARA